MDHILTYMTFIPLAGMAFILCMPRGATKAIRLTALGFTIPPLLMALWLFANFDRSTEAMQFMERAQWIPSFNIQYIMGVDGLSVTMILLTALLCRDGRSPGNTQVGRRLAADARLRPQALTVR